MKKYDVRHRHEEAAMRLFLLALGVMKALGLCVNSLHRVLLEWNEGGVLVSDEARIHAEAIAKLHSILASSTGSDEMEKTARALSSLLESQKTRLEIAKLSRPKSKDPTFWTLVISAIAIVGTLISTAITLSENKQLQASKNSHEQWRDTLQALQDPKTMKGLMGTTLLRPYLHDKEYKAAARELAINALSGTVNSEVFEPLFLELSKDVDETTFRDLIRINRGLKRVSSEISAYISRLKEGRGIPAGPPGESAITIEELEAKQREVDVYELPMVVKAIAEFLRTQRNMKLDLKNTDFWKADLSRTFLSRSTFDEASLGQANLTSAILRGASLVHADLDGADLTECNLEEANLRNSDLTDVTRFAQSKWARTAWWRVSTISVELLTFLKLQHSYSGRTSYAGEPASEKEYKSDLERLELGVQEQVCQRNLRTLVQALKDYESLYGGASTRFPATTGKAFLQELLNKGLINQNEVQQVSCPFAKVKFGTITYRGPSQDLNKIKNAMPTDIIVLCSQEGHKGFGLGLSRTLEITYLDQKRPEYHKAMEGTKD